MNILKLDSSKGQETLRTNRCTFCDDATSKGKTEEVAMMISGYKTRANFNRYNIESDANLKKAAKSKKLIFNYKLINHFIF